MPRSNTLTGTKAHREKVFEPIGWNGKLDNSVAWKITVKKFFHTGNFS